jgi:phosphopantothenoylcysteine decarboxylase/phosphopantothenate--cysteine ligase
MARGFGDDFLSTMIMASTARILVCPSMNDRMFNHPAVRENLEILKGRGISIMAPAEGELACGTEGPGRLQEPAVILEQAAILLGREDLSGMRLLVTAGPTIEPLDPVRYLTNRSSGKMGFALARVARQRGADVTLISGPTNLSPPFGVTLERVMTTEEMKEAVLRHSPQSDVIIKAAAVSDYRPKNMAEQKIKKGDKACATLELVPNPDILAELGSLRGKHAWVLVGFAAETQDLTANAGEKLKAKNLDLIVANDVSREDAGFGSDTNRVKILSRDGEVEDCPLMTKEETADRILDRVKDLWNKAR